MSSRRTKDKFQRKLEMEITRIKETLEVSQTVSVVRQAYDMLFELSEEDRCAVLRRFCPSCGAAKSEDEPCPCHTEILPIRSDLEPETG